MSVWICERWKVRAALAAEREPQSGRSFQLA